MKKSQHIYLQFIKYLQKRNINYERQSDTLITFTRDGLHFLLDYQQDDRHHLRILLPRIYKLDPQEDISDIINDVNERFKVAKVYMIEGEIWAAAEVLVYSQNNIKPLFDRIISILTELYHGLKLFIRCHTPLRLQVVKKC